MSKETTLKILQLELSQLDIVQKNLEKKIERYKKANSIVKNTIAQQDIDDLTTELQKSKIEQQILASKIEQLSE